MAGFLDDILGPIQNPGGLGNVTLEQPITNFFEDIIPTEAAPLNENVRESPTTNFFEDILPSPIDNAPDENEPRDIGLARKAAALAARTIPSLLGAGAGLALGNVPGLVAGGALGGATGERIAQFIEDPGKPAQLLPIAGEALLGALPIGKLGGTVTKIAGKRFGSRVAGALGSGLEGGLFGTGATAVSTLTREGRLPTLGEAGFGATIGTAIGAGVGAARAPLGPARETPVIGAESDAIEAARRADEAIRIEAREAGDAAGNVTVKSPKVMKAVNDAFQEVLARDPTLLENNPALIGGLRSNRVVAEAIESGQIPDFGKDPESALQFAKDMKRSVSSAAMTLQSQMSLLNVANKILGVAEVQAQRPSLIRTIADTRRAVLTQMLGTQMRNAITVGGNMTTVGTARLVQGLGSADPIAIRTGRDLFKAMAHPISTNRTTTAIMEAMPLMKRKMLEFATSEADANNKVVKFARAFNLWTGVWQERGGRALALPAFAREGLVRNGLDGDEFLRNPKAFIEKLSAAARRGDEVAETAFTRFHEAMGDAAQQARAITFSEEATGVVGRQMASLIEGPLGPLLTLEFPFPRFMASYANFLIDHSPAGMLRMFGGTRDAAGRFIFNASDPALVARKLGQVTIGTGMLSMALALRNSDSAGELWYEAKVPGIDKMVDTRPFAPLLAPYLWLAEAMRKIDQGESLSSMSTTDLAAGMLGLSRIQGVGTLGLQFLQGQLTLQTATENLESIIGDVLGSFTVPFRTLKDITNDQRNVDRRGSTMARLFGPVAGNIPFAGEILGLPENVNPTTGKSSTAREPVNVLGVPVPAGVLRQLGVSTVDKGEAETLLNKLGVEAFEIKPRTTLSSTSGLRRQAQPIGRDLDRRIAQIMAPSVIAVTSLLKKQVWFNRMMDPNDDQFDIDRARGYLLSAIVDIRYAARGQAMAELTLKDPRARIVIEAARPANRSDPRALARRDLMERAATRFQVQ